MEIIQIFLLPYSQILHTLAIFLNFTHSHYHFWVPKGEPNKSPHMKIGKGSKVKQWEEWAFWHQEDTFKF